MLLRCLWDRWDLGAWLDERTAEIPGRYRPSLMVELWTVLLCYGGGWLDDLKWLAARSVRRLFGWTAVPDPTTFGRWLRRAGPSLAPLLDELLWHLLRARWAEDGVPRRLTVALDSTVIVRYGEKQAGAERATTPRSRAPADVRLGPKSAGSGPPPHPRHRPAERPECVKVDVPRLDACHDAAL